MFLSQFPTHHRVGDVKPSAVDEAGSWSPTHKDLGELQEEVRKGSSTDTYEIGDVDYKAIFTPRGVAFTPPLPVPEFPAGTGVKSEYISLAKIVLSALGLRSAAIAPTPNWTDDLTAAIKAYKLSKGLPVNGNADNALWTSLAGNTVKVAQSGSAAAAAVSKKAGDDVSGGIGTGTVLLIGAGVVGAGVLLMLLTGKKKRKRVSKSRRLKGRRKKTRTTRTVTVWR